MKELLEKELKELQPALSIKDNEVFEDEDGMPYSVCPVCGTHLVWCANKCSRCDAEACSIEQELKEMEVNK